ncbi:BRCT domain-containing protein [Pseudoscourfieldia marina]
MAHIPMVAHAPSPPVADAAMATTVSGGGGGVFGGGGGGPPQAQAFRFVVPDDPLLHSDLNACDMAQFCAETSELIRQNGGIVVSYSQVASSHLLSEGLPPEKIDYFVLASSSYENFDSIAKLASQLNAALVSDFWIEHVIEQNCVGDPNDVRIHHTPLPAGGIPALANVKIAITAVKSRSAKDEIKAMASVAYPTMEVCRDDTFTHLIAGEPRGKRYEAATSRGDVHIVTPKWLEECLRRWERAPEEEFALAVQEEEEEEEENENENENETAALAAAEEKTAALAAAAAEAAEEEENEETVAAAAEAAEENENEEPAAPEPTKPDKRRAERSNAWAASAPKKARGARGAADGGMRGLARIATSCCHTDEKRDFQQLARQRGFLVLQGKKWPSPPPTHLVLPRLLRVEKVVCALAAGVPLMKPAWLHQRTSSFVDTHAWTDGLAEASAHWRARGGCAFEGLRAAVVGGSLTPPRSTIEAILRAGGAQLVAPRAAQIVVCAEAPAGDHLLRVSPEFILSWVTTLDEPLAACAHGTPASGDERWAEVDALAARLRGGVGVF